MVRIESYSSMHAIFMLCCIHAMLYSCTVTAWSVQKKGPGMHVRSIMSPFTHSIDLRHICQNLNQFGYGKGTKHGGLSDYTIIPARYAYLLKTDLEDAKAAILERKFSYFLMQVSGSIVPIIIISVWSCSPGPGRNWGSWGGHPYSRCILCMHRIYT